MNKKAFKRALLVVFKNGLIWKMRLFYIEKIEFCIGNFMFREKEQISDIVIATKALFKMKSN